MQPTAAVFVRKKRNPGRNRRITRRGRKRFIHQGAPGGWGNRCGGCQGSEGFHPRARGKKISITGHETRRSRFNGTGRPRGMPTRERGRPARTTPGTALAISSTRVDRQRRLDSASAEPRPFPQARRPGATSQGNRAARNGSACGRDARVPGWASSHRSCSSRGHAPAFRAAARGDAAQPSRLPVLCVTSWIGPLG